MTTSKMAHLMFATGLLLAGLAIAKPDDVTCQHGATLSELNDQCRKLNDDYRARAGLPPLSENEPGIDCVIDLRLDMPKHKCADGQLSIELGDGTVECYDVGGMKP